MKRSVLLFSILLLVTMLACQVSSIPSLTQPTPVQSNQVTPPSVPTPMALPQEAEYVGGALSTGPAREWWPS